MKDAMKRETVLRWNLAFSAGATAAGFALVSPRFGGSVALGALLETVNFRALWRFAERFFGLPGAPGGAAVGAFGVRFVLLAVVLYVALDRGADPIGLVVGLSMLLPAVVLAAWQARPADAPVTEAPPPDDPSWDDWNPWLARERDPDEDES